jgi:rSAM/selenodomain-associated transferase 2
MSAAPPLSIIIPVRNDREALLGLEASLAAWRGRGCEIIVVDGMSRDDSAEIARRCATCCIETRPGRARQMNAGARIAQSDWLCFLHADVRLSEGSLDAWLGEGVLPERAGWGCFRLGFETDRLTYRLIAAGINGRARLTGIVSGDQALWVKREWFARIGGFPEIPLMEDIEISKRLRRLAPPCIRSGPVWVSARRYERHRPWRLVFRMWRLRIAYALGASPARLVSHYDPDYPND